MSKPRTPRSVSPPPQKSILLKRSLPLAAWGVLSRHLWLDTVQAAVLYFKSVQGELRGYKARRSSNHTLEEPQQEQDAAISGDPARRSCPERHGRPHALSMRSLKSDLRKSPAASRLAVQEWPPSEPAAEEALLPLRKETNPALSSVCPLVPCRDPVW